MSRGPLPSKLCLLSSLPSQPEGQKVRFLGCVTSYDTARGNIVLGHVYPKGENILVAADVSLVLETLETQCTSVGEWVNVIGYVTDSKGNGIGASVQAVMVWPTGALDIQRYERAIEEGLVELEKN